MVLVGACPSRLICHTHFEGHSVCKAFNEQYTLSQNLKGWSGVTTVSRGVAHDFCSVVTTIP